MSSTNQKPTGEQAGWRLLSSETRFENDLCRLREDEVEVKDGKKIKYAYLERDAAVIIVPITPDGQLVMVKQYRYPVDEWCLEIPAGGTHDVCDADLEEVVRKELREEVGGTAKKLTHIGAFFSCNSMTDEKCHVFLAHDVQLEKKQNTESTESIVVQLVPIAKAIELARTGGVKTGPCALAILMAEPLLQQLDQHRPTPDHLLET